MSRSLLIPLLDGRLIIPRSCVAEVVGFQPPSEMPGAPPWYLGTFAWGSRQIPLVSFEGTCGQTIPPLTGRTRVVVLFALGNQVEGGYYGIVSQGFPQLVRVSADILRPDPTKTFPDIKAGTFLLRNVPGEPGSSVRGHFDVIFENCIEFACGYTAFADYTGVVP